MKRSKYRNQPVVIDGHRFPSKLEAKRYGELRLLEKAGEIANLELQPRFLLSVKSQLICTYVGDFLYTEKCSDKVVCEDAKGVKTDVYRIKRKLLKALYPGIDHREVVRS